MPNSSIENNTQFLKRSNAPDLAYIYHEGTKDMPTLVFLGGFKSDMMGSKASFLHKKCEERGQSYLRFDYSGHGQSEGLFEEGCIGEWAQDAVDVIEHCTSGPVILVGSSMGGWISLLLGHRKALDIVAIIGIAAAPDFTRWMEDKMDKQQQEAIKRDGCFEIPSAYGAPYVITSKLLEDGRRQSVMNATINIDVPVRLLQGKKDPDVPWETAEKIQNALFTDDVEIFFQPDGDHSLSDEGDLALLDKVVTSLLEL